MAARLRAQGKQVDLALHAEKPRTFFSRADKRAFARGVYIGPDDLAKGEVRIKDLAIIKDMDVSSMDDKFLQSVIKFIRANLDNEQLSVEDLAKAVGFSRAQLHRKLKALCDKSANQLIIEIRLNEAKHMLESKTGTVSEVAYSVGYSNMSYFTKSFKAKFGLLPSKV